MTAKFSPHAQSLLRDILLTIREELSREDAIRWNDKIINDVSQLEMFPLSCPVIPRVCFREVPPNPERLRQLIVKPYRIVYEIVGDEVRVLSIHHGRMLVALDDTYWN